MIALFVLAPGGRGGGSGSSSSDAVAFRIQFEGPAGCSGAEDLYRAILARTEHARRAAGDEDAVRLWVRLARVDGRVQGDLRVIAPDADAGARHVEGDNCTEVGQVLALTAALALDFVAGTRTAATGPSAGIAPTGTAASAGDGTTSSGGSADLGGAVPAPHATADSTPTPTAPPTAPPAPVPVEEPMPRRSDSAVQQSPSDRPPSGGEAEVRYSFGVELAAHAMMAEVVSPNASFGGALTARFLAGHSTDSPASIGLSFLYAANDIVASEDVQVRWTALALSACPGWRTRSFVAVEPCARVIGGWLSADDQGVTNPRSAGRAWWSAGALVRARAHIGAGFHVELEGGIEIPLVARRFITTTPEETVAETRRPAGLLGLGIARAL